MDSEPERPVQAAKRKDRGATDQEPARKRAKKASNAKRRSPLQNKAPTVTLDEEEPRQFKSPQKHIDNANNFDTSPPPVKSKHNRRRKWLNYAQDAIESLLDQDENEDIDEYQLAILKRSWDHLQPSKPKDANENRVGRLSRQTDDRQISACNRGSIDRTPPRVRNSMTLASSLPKTPTPTARTQVRPVQTATTLSRSVPSPSTTSHATTNTASPSATLFTDTSKPKRNNKKKEDTTALAAMAFPVGQPTSLPAAQRSNKRLSTAQIARLSTVHPSFDGDKTDPIDKHRRTIVRQSLVEGAFGALMGKGGVGAKEKRTYKENGREKVKNVREQIRVPSSSPEVSMEAGLTTRGMGRRTPGRDVENASDRESDRGLFWDGFTEEDDSDLG